MDHSIPKRKTNRLKSYDYGQNGAYFVTICTQNRAKILSDIVGNGFPGSVFCEDASHQTHLTGGRWDKPSSPFDILPSG